MDSVIIRGGVADRAGSLHFKMGRGKMGRRRWLQQAAGLVVAAGGGCRPARPAGEVVVYTALDREFSEPVFRSFTQQTGVAVRAKYDTEANKTVGLVNLIRSEAKRPRCDLFWNNEILNTIRLGAEGLLAPTFPPGVEDFPPAYRSGEGLWYGFAARARILLWNRSRRGNGPTADRVEQLADARHRGSCGLAKPLFGTSATHAACLFAYWGAERAEQFYRQVAANAQILPGNRPVAQGVASGRIRWGLTDTDDAMGQIRQGRDVEILYPDQHPGGMGTLFLPNTLARLANCPHPQAAERLMAYLLSPEVERRLAEGPSAQIPLNRALQGVSKLPALAEKRPLSVDFQAAAAAWETSAPRLRRLFG